MQRYQFERIYSEMEKEFGKMKKGTEDSYAMLMLPMEGNALKIHRANPKSNSRRLREAIALVLFDVKSRYTQSRSRTMKSGRFLGSRHRKSSTNIIGSRLCVC